MLSTGRCFSYRYPCNGRGIMSSEMFVCPGRDFNGSRLLKKIDR